MNTIRQYFGVVALFGLVAGACPAPAQEPAAAPAASPPASAVPAAAEAAPAAPADDATQHKPLDKRGRADAPRVKGAVRTDRLELGTTTVTGNRELPKVLYIVPWKKSDIGDLAGKPMNSLLDEVLAPVDRDVFRREVVYYRALSSAASQNGAQGNAAAKQGEK